MNEKDEYQTISCSLEKSIAVQAANDNNYKTAQAIATNWRSPEQFIGACRQMLDAPEDLPTSGKSFLGLAAALYALDANVPVARMLADQVRASMPEADAIAAEGATLLSMRGRAGRHLLYALSIQIGNALQKSQPLNDVALGIFGAWCLRRLLEDDHPTGSAIARLSKALVQPNSLSATTWSDKARSRAHALALRNLVEAIKKNEAAAAQYGLRDATPRVVRAMDPISIANRMVRRRTENLIHFATKDLVAGAGGYGTLSEPGLKSAGRELMAGVKAGDKKKAMACLEVVTHLPSKTLLKVPIQIGDQPPTGALAWLNLQKGCYCQTLHKIIERGARPEIGTEHLYEATTQVVTVWLSPPLLKLLRALFNAGGGTANCVEALLGEVAHDPHSAVAGQGAYRYTARRIQESVPTHLLAKGHYRWPVALATNSQFLVSLGRSSYGTCRATDIDAAVSESCSLLGWPKPDGGQTERLVGTFTTPRPQSITAALNFLSEEADEIALDTSNLNVARNFFNRHAVWMSMFLSLAYALRNWVRFALPASELRAGAGLHFDDKNVHAQKGHAVPTAQLVFEVITGWYSFGESFAKTMQESSDAQCRNLALRISERLADSESVESIFTIDAVGRLEPVGSHTWRSALPTSLKLRPNFARQFWPMQLTCRSVEQQLIDILLRHQMDGLHPGSSHSVKRGAETSVRLGAEMNEVLKSLGLHIPGSLRFS